MDNNFYWKALHINTTHYFIAGGKRFIVNVIRVLA